MARLKTVAMEEDGSFRLRSDRRREAGGDLRFRVDRRAERTVAHRADERQGPLRRRRSADHAVAAAAPDDQDIYLLESDVNELAQAKGANVAGLHVVFSTYGIDFDEIDVFYLAGGFGRHLNVEASKRIGLVPWLDSAKIVQAGNTAIEGATIALLSRIEAAGAGRAGEEGGALPAGNAPELLRLLRGGLPVQAGGGDSVREVAGDDRAGGRASRCACAAGGVHAAAGLSARVGARGPRAGTGGVGAGVVCGERAAVDLCAAGGESCSRGRFDSASMASPSRASGLKTRCGRRKRTA